VRRECTIKVGGGDIDANTKKERVEKYSINCIFNIYFTLR
jgi:hypothetical protein